MGTLDYKTNLPEDTSPTSDDLLVVVNDPSGDPSNKKVTIANLFANAPMIGSVKTVTDTYAILTTDYTIICNKATAFTVTLPVAVVNQAFTIKNIGAGTVTVACQGSNYIDGSSTQILATWDTIQVRYYVANNWGIL